jgi:hypothetical protein
MIYEGLRDGAISPLIAQYGYQMTLMYSGPVSINENTGLVSPGVSQTWLTSGLEVSFEHKDIDGTRIKSGDKLVILAADGVLPTPNTDYKLMLGSEIWRIISSSVIQPGGVALTYELHVRK